MNSGAESLASNPEVTTSIERAALAILDGGLVALPTETVYGLGADAENDQAVGRIFSVKGRPSNHPLIVHLPSAASAEGWVDHWTSEMETLAAACWPGPLTMLVPRGPRASDAVTGGRPTVGLRVPAHPLALALLERFGRDRPGGGIAAPSANRYGKVSPTTAEHVLADIGGRLDPQRDLILDGGPADVGVESTIVDLSVAPPQVLRHGGVLAANIARLLAMPLGAAGGPSRTSGMLLGHYAPACEVLPVASADDGAAMLHEHQQRGERCRILDRTGDADLGAHRLYADLRSADTDALDALIIVLPADDGLGAAIRDRVMKAAAGSRRDRPSRAD